MSHDLEPFMIERKTNQKLYFDSNLSSVKSNDLELTRINCSGTHKQHKYIEAKFDDTRQFHTVNTLFANKYLINGVTVRFRLENWKSIDYIALGFHVDKRFIHLKITNPLQKKWQTVTFGINDLVFLIQNGFEKNPHNLSVNDFSIKIKGQSGNEHGRLDLLKVCLWDEEESSISSWFQGHESKKLGETFINRIHEYQTKSLKNSVEASELFYSEGSCTIVKNLPWHDKSKQPEKLQDVNTYRYSWHALHHVAKMILYGNYKSTKQPLLDALDFVRNWMNVSWHQQEIDTKFMWYDHGVAERQLSLIMMYHECLKNDIGKENLDDIKKILMLQGRLLESEAFYASHQVSRYHNHAMFQDVALIITSLTFPELKCSRRWLNIGVKRLEDQCQNLLITENEFSVFLENSIGYHSGVIRLLKISSDIIALFDEDSLIHDVFTGMNRFFELMKYPDGRIPAQGDTMRIPNGEKVTRFTHKPNKQIILLPKAGYGISKGYDDGIAYMFCFFATSISKTHKHEDNLSFTLFYDMIEWLIDPSNYSHEYEEPITAYLRSSAAHNTLTIPEQVHSIEPGLCNLNGKVQEDNYQFIGKSIAFSGYEITRKVEGSAELLELHFEDFISTKKLSKYGFLNLHCGEHVDVDVKENIAVLTSINSNKKIIIQLPSNEITVSHGNTQDKLSGISGLGFMEYSNVHTITCKVPLNTTLNWSIRASKILLE